MVLSPFISWLNAGAHALVIAACVWILVMLALHVARRAGRTRYDGALMMIATFAVLFAATHSFALWSGSTPQNLAPAALQLVSGAAALAMALLFRPLLNRVIALPRIEALEAAVDSRTRELAEARNLLRIVADSIPSFVSYVDRGLVCRFNNEAHRRWLGLDPAELAGRNVSELIDPATLARDRSYIERALRGEAVQFESEVRDAAGEKRLCRINLIPHRDEDGETRGYVAVGTDISDDRRREEDLRRSQQRLELAFAAGGMGHWDIDLTNNTVICSAEYARFYGIEGPYAGDPRPLQALLHPDDLERARERLARACASGDGDYENDYRIIHPSGQVLWIMSRGKIIRDAHGRPVRTLGVAIDMTARRRADEEIARLNRDLERRIDEMQRIYDLAPVGIAVASDRDCENISANAACARLLGVEQQTNVSKSAPEGPSLPFRVFDKNGRELKASDLPMQRAAALGVEIAGDEVDVVHADGRVVNLYEYAVPLFDELQRVRGCLGIFVDITERRRAERELGRARDAAESANRAKSAFLANMSHEIRTPLGAVLGFSELLLDPDQTEAEREKCVEAIKRNGEILSNIVNDLLDLSKIEAGKLEIERTPVRVTELAGDLTSLLGLKAAEKGLRLTVTSDAGVPPVLRTDRLRLRQILLNIVGNAIKFTERGSVDVRIFAPAAPGGGRQLAFEVRDTGAGITAEQSARLFAPFVQADHSTTRRFGGTGLGLALSRRLAQELGGDVRLIESAPGAGSTFLITVGTMPAAGADAASAAAELAALAEPSLGARGGRGRNRSRELEGLRVLMVDDSPDNQILVERLLTSAGASVDVAGNGRNGVDKALRGDYDVVLMDLQMPEMDGFEAMQRLRRAGFRRPIFALTAHALKEERQRCLDGGFDDHLSKPVDRRTLTSRLAQLIN